MIENGSLITHKIGSIGKTVNINFLQYPSSSLDELELLDSRRVLLSEDTSFLLLDISSVAASPFRLLFNSSRYQGQKVFFFVYNILPFVGIINSRTFSTKIRLKYRF